MCVCACAVKLFACGREEFCGRRRNATRTVYTFADNYFRMIFLAPQQIDSCCCQNTHTHTHTSQFVAASIQPSIHYYTWPRVAISLCVPYVFMSSLQVHPQYDELTSSHYSNKLPTVTVRLLQLLGLFSWLQLATVLQPSDFSCNVRVSSADQPFASVSVC